MAQSARGAMPKAMAPTLRPRSAWNHHGERRRPVSRSVAARIASASNGASGRSDEES
ncbi:hypothetical protein BFL35_08315 [Clavibacter michiganensis]|nr:hypothetical protein BFL35_08315 [Clavibacter michiganensis]